MKSWLLGLLQKRLQKKAHRPTVSFRPRLELLEDRVTPSLTYHVGGLVLNNVQAQAVFLGSAWNTDSSLPAVAGQFNSFLTTLVPGGYLNMLGTAGFKGPNTPGGPTVPVGAGSFTGGVSDGVNIPVTDLQNYNNSNPLSSTAYKNSVLTDSQIQGDLKSLIGATVPGTNALYVVFVEPNVVVDIGNGQNSINAFGGYHTSFALNGASVRYAVIPYAGSNGFLNNASGYANSQAPYLNSFDSMTSVATHEVAEAATDPDGRSWYDSHGEEVGDVVNGSTVYVNGYAVQREGSLPASQYNYLPMTPAGATAGHSTTFAVVSGALQVNEVGGSSFIAANPSGETGTVKSVSPQGIDDFGQPMVDVVFSDGKAYEYHDFLPNNPTAVANPSFFPWTFLSANVKVGGAVAGQGVSYVLLTNGALGEYVDPNYNTFSYGFGVNPGAHNGAIATGVTSITGTHVDALGVNAVDYTATVRGKTTAYEWRDVTAAASTTITSSPSATTKHSEVLSSNVLTSTPAQQTSVDVLVVSAPSAAPNVLTVQSVQLAAPTPATAFTPANAQTAHFTLPDGGGGGDPQGGDQSAAPAPAATLADVPVLGSLFTEAVRQLKAAQSVVPPGWMPAAPTQHNAAPSPKNVPQQPAPQGKKGVWTVPLGDLGACALPVAAGLCGAGFEREAHQRDERLMPR